MGNRGKTLVLGRDPRGCVSTICPPLVVVVVVVLLLDSDEAVVMEDPGVIVENHRQEGLEPRGIG